jgi:hypothetical protein
MARIRKRVQKRSLGLYAKVNGKIQRIASTNHTKRYVLARYARALSKKGVNVTLVDEDQNKRVSTWKKGKRYDNPNWSDF